MTGTKFFVGAVTPPDAPEKCEKPNTAKEDTTRSVQLPYRAPASTPGGTATDTEISRVRIISERVGGMRCAIIETIDCPEIGPAAKAGAKRSVRQDKVHRGKRGSK